MGKLNAAREKLYVDVSFWGGIVPGNTRHLRTLIKYGVVGFKCFLCPSGVEEFPKVNAQELELALTEIRDLDVTVAVRSVSFCFEEKAILLHVERVHDTEIDLF